MEPYRVVKNKTITSDHKNAGEAVDMAKETGADYVFYINGRDYGAMVWNKEWSRPVEV